jgi:hypothetical protein
MNDQARDKSGVKPFWILLSVAGAAACAVLAYRRLRQDQPESIDQLLAAAEKAAKDLDAKLAAELHLAG